MTNMTESLPIVCRNAPDLGLDGDDIPRHWLAGDAFKTRYFDAMSCLFPEGEKFFIECVRDYRDEVEDPEFQSRIKEFIYQEGQHGMAHTRYNNRLQRQGVRVDIVLERQKKVLGWFRRRTPRSLTLAQTAAAEHMTAIMAHRFMNHPQTFKGADPNMRALYYWHAMEEIEHKAVAFDVLTKVAKASWFTRCFAMFYVSVLFPIETFVIMNHMFKVDGLKQRWKIWLKGLWWMYGPGGLFLGILPHYLRYYLPGFHPWKAGDMGAQKRWLDAYAESDGDAIYAAECAANVSG